MFHERSPCSLLCVHLRNRQYLCSSSQTSPVPPLNYAKHSLCCANLSWLLSWAPCCLSQATPTARRSLQVPWLSLKLRHVDWSVNWPVSSNAALMREMKHGWRSSSRRSLRRTEFPLCEASPMPSHTLPREGPRAMRNLPVFSGLAKGAREWQRMQGRDL